MNNFIITEDFIIEDLGIQEQDVYDIEVQDNHNFFGNDILVHNSGYFKLPKAFIEKLQDNKIDKIDQFIDQYIQPVINDASKEIGDIFNATDPSKISAKREVIADSGVFIAKKRYFMRVFDSEGVRFAEPHIKTMGVDIVRSSTPKWCRKTLKNSIEIILDKSEADLKKWLQDVKKEFTSQSLMDVAKTTSVSSSKYTLGVDKSIPINSRAFLTSNRYIEAQASQEFQPLTLGEKVKMLYLKVPNPLGENIFAFNNEKFASRFKEYVDWDLNFEKFFLEPLKTMTEALGFNVKQNKEVLADIW